MCFEDCDSCGGESPEPAPRPSRTPTNRSSTARVPPDRRHHAQHTRTEHHDGHTGSGVESHRHRHYEPCTSRPKDGFFVRNEPFTAASDESQVSSGAWPSNIHASITPRQIVDLFPATNPWDLYESVNSLEMGGKASFAHYRDLQTSEDSWRTQGSLSGINGLKVDFTRYDLFAPPLPRSHHDASSAISKIRRQELYVDWTKGEESGKVKFIRERETNKVSDGTKDHHYTETMNSKAEAPGRNAEEVSYAWKF